MVTTKDMIVHVCPRQPVSAVPLVLCFIAGVFGMLEVMQELGLSGDMHV